MLCCAICRRQSAPIFPLQKNKTVPVSGRHNHCTVFGSDVITAVRSILFQMIPTTGGSDSLKDKRDISL
jgi:hypothetical protein